MVTLAATPSIPSTSQSLPPTRLPAVTAVAILGQRDGVPHETIPGGGVTKVWSVKATTAALVELGDHLRCERVARWCWSPPRTTGARSTTCWSGRVDGLAGQRRTGQERPGQAQTDKIDAVWLAKLAERSMVSPSLVPTEPVRHVRDLARARFDLLEECRSTFSAGATWFRRRWPGPGGPPEPCSRFMNTVTMCRA
jgi:hypothetical protein